MRKSTGWKIGNSLALKSCLTGRTSFLVITISFEASLLSIKHGLLKHTPSVLNLGNCPGKAPGQVLPFSGQGKLLLTISPALIRIYIIFGIYSP